MKFHFASMFLSTGLLALAGLNLSESEAPKLPGAKTSIDASSFESLQAAIDAVPKDGGIVHLPAGKFEIAEPLIIRHEDFTLQGVGTATHIVNTNTEGEPAILIAHEGVEDPKVQKDRLWRIKIANLRITGNEQSGTGILAKGIQEIHVDAVTVSENGGDGITLDHCYEDPRVSDCLITYNKQVGLNLLGCHDIVVSANHFEENNDALHCIDGFNLCMSGNNLDDHLQHGVVIENTYGSVVAANMIEECNGTAVIMDRNCYGNTVSANVIAHNGAGVDLRDAHGCAISANTFTLMKTDAVHIGPDSGSITLTGNHFSNSDIGEGEVKRGTNDLLAAGLVLEGTHHIGVTGNGFSSLTTTAVEARGPASSQVLFDGNVFNNVTTQDNDISGVHGERIFTPRAEE